jgi:ABC-type sugar transport system ATPase subunit
MSSSPAQTDRPTIAAHAIASGYSGIEVLHGLDFTINHEVFAVLGANGAGKTTLIKTIAKVLPLISGRMEYSEHDITRMPPYTLAAHGLAYVPQEANTFRDMTVAENLAVGALIGSRPAAEKLDEVFEVFPDRTRIGASRAIGHVDPCVGGAYASVRAGGRIGVLRGRLCARRAEQQRRQRDLRPLEAHGVSLSARASLFIAGALRDVLRAPELAY